jgi:hypothetical protein
VIVGPLATIGMASGHSWLVWIVAAAVRASDVKMRWRTSALAAHELVDREPFEARLDRSASSLPLLLREISWSIKWIKHARQPQ